MELSDFAPVVINLGKMVTLEGLTREQKLEPLKNGKKFCVLVS